MTDRFHVLSGCSGGGKSTLLAELAAIGYATVEEPGRRVLRAGGPAPWRDQWGFLEACVAQAGEDYASAAQQERPVIFDRCLIDALSGLDAMDPGRRAAMAGLQDDIRYASPVFLAPPWSELFENDVERRHSFDDAVAEYDRLVRDFTAAGYAIEVLPKVPLAERVAWVRARVGPPGITSLGRTQ